MEDKIKGLISKKLNEVISANSMEVELVSPESVVLIPSKKGFGDLSSPILMKLKKSGFEDVDINSFDKLLSEKELSDIGAKKVEVVDGYINIFLDDNLHKKVVNDYSDDHGVSYIGKGKQVMVEFGQPNTHKALQLGHFKSAVTGLPIANLYKNLGYEVIKANYFGDIGMQVANCLWGVINRSGTWYSKFNRDDLKEVKENITEIIEKEGVDEAAKYLDKSYVLGRSLSADHDNVKEEVKDINRKLYERSDENLNELYEFTRDISIKHQDKAFMELGVEYDIQYPESVVWELGKSIVQDNIGKVFVEDDGAIIFEGDKYGLHRWVFLTSEGFPTYSGKDLGLAVKKFQEYPKLSLAIVTTSVEQNAYFRAMIKALEMIYPELEGKYKHLGFGWLLFENKKMSSKTGKNIKYTDLITQAVEVAKGRVSAEKGYPPEQVEDIANKVAMGALKFGILSHEFHKDINWELDKFMSMTGFAAPYVMYSYARGRSILSACEFEYKEGSSIDIEDILNSSVEIELLKKIGEYPELIKNAGLNIAPHLLCRYLYELSDIFNRFYGEFNIQNEEDGDVKEGRLRVIHITTDIIKRGLGILGINTVEQM